MCNREYRNKQGRFKDISGGDVHPGLSPHGKIIAMEGELIMAIKNSTPTSVSGALEQMTREEFDAKIARAIKQAEAGEGVPADEFFASLKREVLSSSAG